MATVFDDDDDLDLLKFNSIIKEYSSTFQNPPKNAYQITQFCKGKAYNFKYHELNPFFFVWKKQQQNTTNKGRNKTDLETEGDSDHQQYIDWDSFWNEYQVQYKYPPKKAVHLWNFAKDEKNVSVKYKFARIAFDRINGEFKATNIEGRTRSETDLGLKANSDNVLRLKITKYTKNEEIESIRISFLECLSLFRNDILHDPSSPLQLFNYLNQNTKYKVRYGDVKSSYKFAVKNKWFKPKKRMKKVLKSKNNEGSEHDDEGEGEYVLEFDDETIENKRLKEEEKKKEIVINDTMNDDEFDVILIKYDAKYKNPPRNPSQIMNFAKEIGVFYKYKCCRIAFNRWQKGRKGFIPKMEETQPGNTFK